MSHSTLPPDVTGPLSLAGRVAMVTGSSRGIGRAIALYLGALGADVHLHGRGPSESMDESRRGLDGLGRRGANLYADLTTNGAACRLVEEAWGHGPIDLWVNNAGADVLTGGAKELPFDEKLELLWQVDVRGTIVASREVGRRMQERGRGQIINIGWSQVDFGMEGESGQMFGATKGAIMAFTRSLAKSLAPHVRVNGVAPGWIRTAWGDTASPYWDQRARSEALLGRWGEADDVARVVGLLATDALGFVNGQILNVDGGFAGPARRSGSH